MSKGFSLREEQEATQISRDVFASEIEHTLDEKVNQKVKSEFRYHVWLLGFGIISIISLLLYIDRSRLSSFDKEFERIKDDSARVEKKVDEMSDIAAEVRQTRKDLDSVISDMRDVKTDMTDVKDRLAKLEEEKKSEVAIQ